MMEIVEDVYHCRFAMILLDKSCAVIGDTVYVSANSLVDESVGHLNG
jgi:hypothetical protein